MEELALILKNKRLEQGYLNLDIPESKIILDENGKAIEVKKYETTFANEIIEQFMLTANETVAEKFYWLEAPFIYRVHEEPEFDKIQETNKFLFNIGEKIKCSNENIKPKAFSDVLDKFTLFFISEIFLSLIELALFSYIPFSSERVKKTVQLEASSKFWSLRLISKLRLDSMEPSFPVAPPSGKPCPASKIIEWFVTGRVFTEIKSWLNDEIKIEKVIESRIKFALFLLIINI